MCTKLKLRECREWRNLANEVSLKRYRGCAFTCPRCGGPPGPSSTCGAGLPAGLPRHGPLRTRRPPAPPASRGRLAAPAALSGSSRGSPRRQGPLKENLKPKIVPIPIW